MQGFGKFPSSEGGLLHRRDGGGGVCHNENCRAHSLYG
jgi:hypothetical protein